MKPYVMMTRAGDLFLAYRITFLDQANVESTVPEGAPVQFALMEHHGWICEFPKDLNPYPVYFSRDLETMVENLGEL